MRQDMKEILISEEEIKEIVSRLGKVITEDYKDKNLYLVTVLKGAVVFLGDLMRAIECHCEIDFMVVSSYGSGVKTSGNVKIIKDIDATLEDKDVLIVEDILDTGLTLNFLMDILRSRQPRSLEICTLLDKPARRGCDLTAKYIGKEIPDEFVVGYGLDFAEKYRNAPYIGILDPSVYSE